MKAPSKKTLRQIRAVVVLIQSVITTSDPTLRHILQLLRDWLDDATATPAAIAILDKAIQETLPTNK